MARIFKRENIWWITYYANGKRVRKSLKTTSKRVAERERIAIEAESLEPHRHVKAEKNVEIDTFWAQYLGWAKDHLRPNTITIQTHFWKQLTGYLSPKRLGDITPDGLEAYKRWRLAEGNSERTINNALTDIHSIFPKAISSGHFTGENPVKRVRRYKLTKKQPEFHTEDELKALLKTSKAHGVEWVVLLGGWAGLRKAEIVNARWEWFDFDSEKPTIHIKASEEFTIKDSEERTIPMSRQIRDTLSPHRQEEGYLFESNRKSEGRYRYRYEPKKSMVASLKDAGLTTKNPFQRLRMTFGSIHVQKGKSIFIVSKWLGHSSVRVTEKHYTAIQAYDSDIDAF